ncbi:MAG: NUDIX domain-containing protein [Candidatus Pacebacteria bacterium]|nr:NUDIX domain-containing protein [Candidatus Paceibacterota bacterium]MCF7857289.1 NUDIX domain-containing protein [Candidatus Paceibacterota bacterium]
MLYDYARKTLIQYAALNHTEDIQDLVVLVENDETVVTKSNTTGHITASGLVLCRDKILLIFHKKLQKLIQPGGHLEDDMSLCEAAIREVKEETGLDTVPHGIDGIDFKEIIPLHIDIQIIPFNEKKNEAEHLHYDCMFLLNATHENVDLDLAEVEKFSWVSPDEQLDDVGLTKAFEKIRKIV